MTNHLTITSFYLIYIYIFFFLSFLFYVFICVTTTTYNCRHHSLDTSFCLTVLLVSHHSFHATAFILSLLPFTVPVKTRLFSIHPHFYLTLYITCIFFNFFFFLFIHHLYTHSIIYCLFLFLRMTRQF